MDWLNYHHLRFFSIVAREGRIARACERLRLAQPTISKQLHQLERSLGEQLFQRVGRRLTRTRTGQVVCRYAEEKTTGNRWGFLASLRAEGQGRLRTATTVRSSDGGHWAACWRTAFTTVATVAQASA